MINSLLQDQPIPNRYASHFMQKFQWELPCAQTRTRKDRQLRGDQWGLDAGTGLPWTEASSLSSASR